MIKKVLQFTALCAAALIGHSSAAATVVVNQFETGGSTVDHWYVTEQAGGGSASIGGAPAGGPLGSGAAVLHTDNVGADRAEVATFNNFGLASAVLGAAQLSYSYYKTSNGTENSTAPSLKLTISAPGGTGDNYGALIYEPYWNQGGTVPNDSWQSVSIDSNTGAGAEGSGGWWWNGGFNISSGAGGPPLRSLAEWLAAFQLSDPDFANASIVAVSVGIGTNNPNQIADYFDAVHIQLGMHDTTYNFEPQGVPDSGTTVAMLGLAMIGVAGFSLRKRLAKV